MRKEYVGDESRNRSLCLSHHHQLPVLALTNMQFANFQGTHYILLSDSLCKVHFYMLRDVCAVNGNTAMEI